MKRTITNIIYECEYCGAKFETAKETSIHENNCDKRPDLIERQKELESRRLRVDMINKLYQAESITELNELWKEFILKYYKNIYNSYNTSIKLEPIAKSIYSLYPEADNGYRLIVKPGPYSSFNHQIDMTLSKFPNILTKLEQLKLAEKSFSENYNEQLGILCEKENELRLEDVEHQANLKKCTELSHRINALTKQLNEIRNKLEISNTDKYNQAKELINYIDYNKRIKDLKIDLEIK